LVVYPAGLVALYGVNPKPLVTFALVKTREPANVRFPETVTVPLSVKPLTVPVPPIEVTVPTVEDVPAPISLRSCAPVRYLTTPESETKNRLVFVVAFAIEVILMIPSIAVESNIVIDINRFLN
jgi:hypothetical protein